MLIMGRPPVTNLYETFVFVAWTGVVMGLLMAWLQKQGLGILAGGLAGLVFLVIAGRYSLDGDTMGMLAAVLDSNLWLATHVVTISLGYAGCVVAGIIGHVVIIQELLRPRAGRRGRHGPLRCMPSWPSGWYSPASARSWAASGPTSPGAGSGAGIPRRTAPC